MSTPANKPKFIYRLDPLVFKKAADTSKNAVISTRISSNDSVEAKANIEAMRIIESNPVAQEIIEMRRDEIRTEEAVSSSSFQLPPEEMAGLIDPGIEPDPSQVDAVRMLVQEQYGCMIGAAGSGKTTTLRIFLHKMIYGDESEGVEPMRVRRLEGKQGLNIALVAYTGIASQVIKSNMPQWLHESCKTIHSLLEYAPVSTMVTKENGELKESMVFMPSRTKFNRLEHDIIVIDEYSMVGVDLWHEILDACQPWTKIFVIGDLNQLPPVAAHSAFPYLLSNWHVSELTKIHRQKEAAANKIIDVAHAILKGNTFTFDNPGENPNWRVAGFKLDHDLQKAGQQIVSITNQLRTKRVHESVDPDRPLIYDPYRDRIITAGNGYDENNSQSMVQQHIINSALSQLIEPPSDENPRIIIDAGLSKKIFARGHRVMATRNEPPNTIDRVTNGMVGRILEINRNPGWSGNAGLVGSEKEVQEFQKRQITLAMKTTREVIEDSDFDPDVELDDFSSAFQTARLSKEEAGSLASHSITVEFQTGAIRTFTSRSQVDSLQLAYASTCHKCQGSQMDTAIIVVHHGVKGQLSREWLYTAVTRAQKRVVFLYTDFGIRAAVAKQKIFGSTLEQKIKKYQQLNDEMLGPAKKKVRLYIND